MRFELGQEVECELHGIEAGQSSRESGLRRGRTEALGNGIFGNVVADLGLVGGCVCGRNDQFVGIDGVLPCRFDVDAVVVRVSGHQL